MTEIEKLTAGHPDTQSADIVAGNIEALRALFPEAFTEGKIDFEVLKQCLGGAVDEREEKYGLNWHGKRRARQIALTPSTGTLLPCPDDSVDWDTTQNLMIEGDNLEVLKLLQKSYAGRVKVIYIDPPYNTGKDFVYPDDFREGLKNYLSITGQIGAEGKRITSNTKSSGRYHTAWLNMMLPRLKLAKSLLLEAGLVFISIDSVEAANLRVLMDEVFGEENFIGLLPTVMNLKGNNDAFAFSDTHEFTVVYAKSKGSCTVNGIPVSEDALEDWEEDEYGLFKRADTLRRTGQDASRERRPNGWFPVFIGSDGVYATEDNQPLHPEDEMLWPMNESGDELSWTWSKAKINEDRHNLVVVDGRNGKNIYKKQRPALGDLPTSKPKSIVYKPEYSSSNGTAELTRLLGSNVFDSPPKPRALIRDLVIVGSEKDSIIMDFFAGTGTTGHAVMAQNAADGGTRRFILVQLPQPLDEEDKDQKVAARFCRENGLPLAISEITKARLRASSKQVLRDAISYMPDTGFRNYKLASSNIKAWQPDLEDMDETLFAHTEHLVPGRTEADILTELLLKLGLDLCVPIETKNITGKSVHSIGAGALIVCLSDGITRETVEGLAQGIIAWWQALAPAGDTRVVFKDSAFADDVAKTNMAAILHQAGIKDMRSL